MSAAFACRFCRAPMLRCTTRRHCPECERDHYCAVCGNCNATLCTRKESDCPTKNGVGWWHRSGGQALPRTRSASPKTAAQPVVEIAPVERRNDVYVAFLRALTLKPEHLADLTRRGFTKLEATSRGYKSVPTVAEGREIARRLAHDFDLRGVPGFFRERDEWGIVKRAPGYYLPFKDERGQIVGLQSRDMNPQTSAKYIWFSSKDLPGGSRSPVHYAAPHLLRAAPEVLITEGQIKSELAAKWLGVPVVAAAGVSNFGATFAAELRRKTNAHEAVVAFDADFRTKPEVQTALAHLLEKLEAARWRVRVRTWPLELGKGLDDYLLMRTEGRAAA